MSHCQYGKRTSSNYSRKIFDTLLMVDVPTVVVMVMVAGPALGSTQVSVLPAQNPLPGPDCPCVPNAVSCDNTMSWPAAVPNGFGQNSVRPSQR